MKLELNCGEWKVESDGCYYVINGNSEDGYDVFDDVEYEDGTISEEVLYSSKDFESCLVWCMNN